MPLQHLKRAALIAGAALLLALTAAAARPAVYRLDPRASVFTVHVASAGLLAFAGHPHTIAIRDFSGEARFPGGVPGRNASVRVTIPAASMAETSPHFTEKQRQAIDQAMRGKALEVGKYPTVTFRSTRVAVQSTGPDRYHAAITGLLTLHGVTLPVTVPADVTLQGDTLHATGSFSIKHSDFKMKRISAAGGAVIAGNKMTLRFEVVGRRRPRSAR